MQPKVNIYGVDGTSVVKSVERPEVFDMEIREDLVKTVVRLVSQNSRQPYAVSKYAGMQHSAESWGTGRAMARVPRVKGSGTRRAGQGAFANFCRSGRMAHPTKVTRRWHRKTPKTLRRIACAMSVAATAHSSIVEGRGHRISNLEMLPLVISDDISGITKTKQAYELLQKLHLDEDLERVRNSKSLTAGKGKMRGRRYNKKRGVLIISDGPEMAAFRNIEGVDQMNINALNILGLSPGGNVGRLVLWTESAFLKLNPLFGSIGGESELKKGFSLPVPSITVSDLGSYFYSDEIQSLIKLPSLVSKGTCKKSELDINKASEYIEMLG